MLGASSAENRTGGLVAPCFRPSIGKTDPGERDHRYQTTISRSYVCRSRTCKYDLQFLRRHGARSPTRCGQARVPSIENPKARAAYLGVCGRTSAITCRSRRLDRWSELRRSHSRTISRFASSYFIRRVLYSKRVLRGSARLEQLIAKSYKIRHSFTTADWASEFRLALLSDRRDDGFIGLAERAIVRAQIELG